MARSPASEPTDAAARHLASEVFVLGFPLLLMDAIRRAHPLASTGVHRFAPGAEQLIPGLFVDDPHCLHTTAVLDLASSACVLHLPNTHGRYLSVTLFDAAGEPFASLGSHSGEGAGADVVVASPRWRGEVGPGVRALRAPCDFVWILSRIIGRSAADRPMVETLAARQHFSRAAAEPPVPGAQQLRPTPQLPWLEPILVREMLDMEPLGLFHRLTQLVERAPATTQRRIGGAIAARLALLGRDGPAWPGEARSEVMRRGFADGWKSVQLAHVAAASAAASGEWTALGAETQASASARIAAAFDALGAPLKDDILSLRCGADARGRALTGAEQYRIVFPAAELPPALSAWRLCAHEGRPAGAGAVIGDHCPLALTEDGGLEIVIRRDPPRRRPAANWLAAPAGPFVLTLRLYEPTADALTGRWRMRAVERRANAQAPSLRPEVGRRVRRRVPGPSPSAPRPRMP